jgi:L-alanine-DL-glutamate epimerase-like enolase superfamily enzyme
MKITDLKCAVIGENPVIRINTDEGIYGYGQAENTKPYLKPHVLFYKKWLLGEDPTNVERVMLKIRRMGSFKPWGSAVSAIEMALWDIAGKAAGIPVHKLLGGKIRDKVRVYNGGVRFAMNGQNPEDYAEDMRRMKASPQGFTIIKASIGFHSAMPHQLPNFSYDEPRGGTPQANPYFLSEKDMKNPAFPSDQLRVNAPHADRGLLTEKSMKHIIACAEAMKSVLGDDIGLALDCGPGWMVPDAIRVARALEPLNLMWMEDLITGDYTPYTLADVYREVTQATSTPIHTGEQIYLRQNFKDLIERHAVRILGPDPEDIGGLAELKWVAEYADLHGILMAPHGVFDGLIGLAALVHVCATLPQNYIAFEYPIAQPAWWYDIIEGLPDPLVRDGLIEVWDTPGLGVDFRVDRARQYLSPEDQDFFD